MLVPKLRSLESGAPESFFAWASTRLRRIDLGNAKHLPVRQPVRVRAPYFKTENGDFIAVLARTPPLPSPSIRQRILRRPRPPSPPLSPPPLPSAGRASYVVTDGLGASRIYTNGDNSVWSNSFLAMLEVAKQKTLDSQACYEYVTSGSVFGRRTLVEGISTLPANAILSINGDETRIHQRPSPIANETLGGPITLDRVADYHCAHLSEVFAPIAENYGDRIRLSFSGGFDSRLMLAMLMKHGAKPTLFVYGNPDDEDVRIARLITKEEGLPLEHIDKSTVPAPDPEAFIGETEKNLFAFDGWKVETPLFDFGADRQDRLKRHVDGQVPLNGSLGEIYRNFFYMPDRPSSTGAVISTFYSRFDPKAFTDKFDEKSYRAAMAESMREAIGAESDEFDPVAGRGAVSEISRTFLDGT